MPPSSSPPSLYSDTSVSRCHIFTCRSQLRTWSSGKPHLRTQLRGTANPFDCLNLFHSARGLKRKKKTAGMDNRLTLSVLFVTLSWMFMVTSATTTMSSPMNTTHNTSTTMPPHNMTTTTASHNMTTTMPSHNMTTTMAPHNMTTTMAPHNMTTTMASHNMTTTMPSHNMTTTMASHNMTTTMASHNMTTTMPSHNMTTTMAPHNMTTTMASHNMTTTMASHNMTTTMASHNMTTTMASHNLTTPMSSDNTSTPTAISTSAPATEAPPVTANTTVETLETPITRSECGTQELCASEPSDCDPSQNSGCFFLSAKSENDTFAFGLSGESEGYIGLTLSTDDTVGNNDTTYICANNNGKVKFFSTVLNNGKLTPTELNVRSVKGRVIGKKIQCEFNGEVPSAQTRATTGVAVAISTGPFNSTSNTLGSPTFQLKSSVIDLSNPNATVTNTLNNTNTTTSPPSSTGHTISLQQSLMQALLISLAILGLAQV